MGKIALAAASAGLMVAAPFTAGATASLLELTSVGLAIGAAALNNKTGQVPLQDLQVSSSAEGSPIPFGYGTMRFSGQVIWCPGISYAVASTSSKGGQTQTSYTYSSSFAAAFGEGPATVGRIWADTKLIYNGGAPYGSVAPWSADTAYQPEDLVSYQWNPGTGTVTAILKCLLPNTDITPPGNSLYWALAEYAFWESSVQYMPGNEVCYPGLASEAPQSGQIYGCIVPSSGDEPDTSPGHWQQLASYYIAPTIYPGNGSQDPDPLIQGIQGTDATPAFRGICYGVWDSFPLSAFGNRIPNLRAEVTFTGYES